LGVSLSATGLLIDGKHVPVYSGTVHYWRLERALWPLILDQVLALGFGMIETYIPWSVHETSPGHYDWGQEDERKDVEAFMRLCEERGLWLQVRPGPLINAELTDFGFPEWVLLDPRVQARSGVGSLHLDAAWGLHPPHQFPVPSYASETFYEAAGTWFDAICPIIARHLAPSGCVVAVQSDNETCYMFHEQPYATDYSDASIALYREFLRGQYSTIEALNAIYGTCHSDFAAIEPPRDCTVTERQDVPWHIDWVAYKEYQIRWCVVRIARMLRKRGIQNVPIFHDVAYQYSTPLDLSRLEAEEDIDWVGLNLYRNKESYSGAAWFMRFLAGATRLPFVPEFGSGLWSHHARTTMADEQEFITLTALMHGLKAINFYMLVERDRWQGCPITRHGTLRPDYASFFEQLLAFLHRYQFWNFERQPQALVLLNYDLGRYAAMATTMHYAHADLYGLPRELFQVDLDLGFHWDVQAEANDRSSDNWLGTVLQSLKQRRSDYDLADTHLPLERLQRYPLVCVPCADFMDVADQQRLLDYVHAGGHLVLGPGVPYLDPTLQLSEVLALHVKEPGEIAFGQGRITWVRQHEVEQALQQVLPATAFSCDAEQIEVNLLKNGDETLLFAANPAATCIDTRVKFAGAKSFRQAWGKGEVAVEGDTLALTLEPYSIQIWEVARD
jgi:beta-galactosidase